MSMVRYIPILMIFMVGPAMAQVRVDRALILDGEQDAQRQVIGLPNVNAPDAMLSAGMEQTGAYRTIEPSGTNVWVAEIEALEGGPLEGTQLMLIAPVGSNGLVTVVVNGTGPYPLVQRVGVPFDASGLPAGTPIAAVFDGTSFHVLNGSVYARRPCDEGTVAVTDEFCIEAVEHSPLDFFEANLFCAEQGLRLCNWTEFIVACNKAGELGLTGMLGNWEWTDDAVNENGTARIAGSVTCPTAGTSLVTGAIPRNFRCCHSR